MKSLLILTVESVTSTRPLMMIDNDILTIALLAVSSSHPQPRQLITSTIITSNLTHSEAIKQFL